MSRPSSIDQLPQAVRDALNSWLRDPGITQTEATERANSFIDAFNGARPGEEKVPHVNRHAVNRYDIKMRDVGARLQQSRQVSEMWIARLGTEPEGKMGRLLNEMLRTLAFELTEKVMASDLNEDTLPGVIDQIKNLSLTSMRLEKSLSENIKTELEIRNQERIRVAETVAVSARKLGVSQETIDIVRKDVLGMAE